MKDLRNEIEKFQIEGYASKYFAKRKKGILFRKTVPLEEIIKYQSYPITAPLLIGSKPFEKIAIKTFKLISQIMSSKSKMEVYVSGIQEILDSAIKNGAMRDEIFVQICKVICDLMSN